MSEKHVRTTGIGAIARFEAHFGRIWGFGKKDADLTDSQRQWRAVWELARGEILDHTNGQIRLVNKEQSNG